MLTVISDDTTKPHTLNTTTGITSTTSTIDWYDGPHRQSMVFVETEPIARVQKKKILPVEPWRSKRKGGKGIR